MYWVLARTREYCRACSLSTSPDTWGVCPCNATRCWVTAFGFRPGMSDDVLRHFQKYGTIISQKVSSSNWLHIQ